MRPLLGSGARWLRTPSLPPVSASLLSGAQLCLPSLCLLLHLPPPPFASALTGTAHGLCGVRLAGLRQANEALWRRVRGEPHSRSPVRSATSARDAAAAGRVAGRAVVARRRARSLACSTPTTRYHPACPRCASSVLAYTLALRWWVRAGDRATGRSGLAATRRDLTIGVGQSRRWRELVAIIEVPTTALPCGCSAERRVGPTRACTLSGHAQVHLDSSFSS